LLTLAIPVSSFATPKADAMREYKALRKSNPQFKQLVKVARKEVVSRQIAATYSSGVGALVGDGFVQTFPDVHMTLMNHVVVGLAGLALGG
jgi:hypothetical protein